MKQRSGPRGWRVAVLVVVVLAAITGVAARGRGKARAFLSEPVRLAATPSQPASAVQQRANHSSNQSSAAEVPFRARVDAAVGKAWALYFSSYAGHKATSVEALDTYQPAKRGPDVWDGATILPAPSCALKLRSQTNYPTDRRKANLRLAEIAVCNYMAGTGASLPGCGAESTQVCELQLMVPMPSSDEHQEPHIAAAMALVAYSRLCAFGKNQYEQDQCAVHRSEVAICAGLASSGSSVQLRAMPGRGFIDLKMEDAYILGFRQVILPAASEGDFHDTQFHANSTNVLKWSREPPQAVFCSDLSCLVSHLIR